MIIVAVANVPKGNPKKNPPFPHRSSVNMILHPIYRARAAAATRPIHPATILPAPEVEVLEALVEVEVLVDFEADSEEVPVAVLEEDLPVLLAVEETVGTTRETC